MSSGTATPIDPSAHWWKEITRNQWYALLAGKIGWMLDAFDVMLYVFCLKTIMEEWHMNPAVAGFMVTVTLFASSFGGIIFGAVADKWGRKKALMATVLIFSICSGLSGLSQNLVQLAIARAILGLGMGGEWASGALLVSESWPAKHRGKAIGLMQGGWALGYIAAAIAAATILPRFGWRVMFFVGVIPALFALWIRTKVEEVDGFVAVSEFCADYWQGQLGIPDRMSHVVPLGIDRKVYGPPARVPSAPFKAVSSRGSRRNKDSTWRPKAMRGCGARVISAARRWRWPAIWRPSIVATCAASSAG